MAYLLTAIRDEARVSAVLEAISVQHHANEGCISGRLDMLSDLDVITYRHCSLAQVPVYRLIQTSTLPTKVAFRDELVCHDGVVGPNTGGKRAHHT